MPWLLVLSALASAAPTTEPLPPKVPTAPAERTEIVFGFHGGLRSWGDVPFTWTDEDTRGMAGAVGPFEAAPFQHNPTVGPLFEVRHVARPLRIIGGYRAAFPDWGGERARVARPQGGGRVPAAVTGAYGHEFRFGLGVEGVLDRAIVPFADLMGDVSLVRAQLALDGEPANLVSFGYALTPRAGVHIDLSKIAFIEVAGEYGIFGPTDYGVHLVVGLQQW